MGQMQRVSGRATTTTVDSGTTTVIYHRTPVVKFSDREITLNTGGWKTVTTKARMNQASNQYDLGYCVFQRNFDWFVSYRGKDIPFDSNSMTLDR